MLSNADFCDSLNSSQYQTCAAIFKSFGGKKTFSGMVKTLKVFEDIFSLKQLVAEPQPIPSVIVVDGSGSLNCALCGDILASLALQNNITGLIINGCVRDTKILAEMPIGILALASNPKRPKIEQPGQRDIVVDFWGISWKPGEYVYVDEDGVVITSVVS